MEFIPILAENAKASNVYKDIVLLNVNFVNLEAITTTPQTTQQPESTEPKEEDYGPIQVGSKNKSPK